ncbi:hypothetical protein ENSA5_46360 [Enhygromyxa salina]|uniref:Uncharacterized protein n=1 Tax=Enhygromyxa salina TaxID=215803 RepID=A0A2S9XJK6_9BACT|nr:hypothetical protein [Enhygromyxa salina]PRP92871.1 hypothetical protein ENSA5_46360 [Enhygromyxa salina]
MPRRRLPLLLLLLLALPMAGGASCPAKRSDCEYDSSERCLWERGELSPAAGGDEQLDGEGGPAADSGGSNSPDSTELDVAVSSMIEIMRAGVEWSLVDEQARGLCREPNSEGQLVPTEVIAAPDDAWSCRVSLDDQQLTLEAGSGVLSLSSVKLDDGQSDELFESARARFDERCAGRFVDLEGTKGESFLRCSLPEGPYLVLARFPRDLDQRAWQVSIAIVDAG